MIDGAFSAEDAVPPRQRHLTRWLAVQPNRTDFARSRGYSTSRACCWAASGALVLLLILGFWWTRGEGAIPGGSDDPARQALCKYEELGDRLPDPGEDPDSN
jgi:hypothetical protein